MKLQKEFAPAFEKYIVMYPPEKIQAHKDYLKEHDSGVHSLDVRLAHDMIHGVYTSRGLSDLYDKYNCNDTHISTLAMRLYNEYIKKYQIH